MTLENCKATGLKKHVIILFLIFFPSMFFAQNVIVGKWKTKDVIGYGDKAIYTLIKEKESNYGRYVIFNLDGTFLCNEIVKCLDDCFVSISGTYTVIDNDCIHMNVDDVCFYGSMCEMKKRNKEDIIKDLGVFYIKKEGDNKIILISSKD